MYSTVPIGNMLRTVTRSTYGQLVSKQCYRTLATSRSSSYDNRTIPGATPTSNATPIYRFKPVTVREVPVSNINTTPVRSYSDGTMTTALALIKDIKNIKSSPMPALVLGLSGLLPFVCPPAFMMLTGSSSAFLAYAQGVYGACILSFIGGVRWGLTLPDDAVIKPNWINLGYSITPPLVAWLALLLPTSLALTTLMAGLGGAAYMDITMWGYPAWFKAMRFLLTITAILSLWTTILLMFTLKDSKKKSKSTTPSETSSTAPTKAISTGSTELTTDSSSKSILDLVLEMQAELSSLISTTGDDHKHESWWLQDEEDPILMFIAFEDD